MPRPRMSNEWMDVYNALPELPNLDSISLHFDRHAGAEDNYCGDEEFQGPLERISNVDNVFQLLKGRIRNLSIRNIQLHSWMPHSVTGLGGILSIEQACVWDRALALKNSTLEKLDSLRMNVVHLEPHGEAGPVYKVCKILRRAVQLSDLSIEPRLCTISPEHTAKLSLRYR